jgi:hypothetical protein
MELKICFRRRFVSQVELQAAKQATELTGGVGLARLTSSHLLLLLLLLSAGEEEVGSGKVAVGVLRDGFFAERHATDGGHVGFGTEHEEWDAKSASDFTHAAETFLVVGAGAADEDRDVVLDETGLVLAEGGDDAWKGESVRFLSDFLQIVSGF